MIKKYIFLLFVFVSASYAQQIHQESFEGATGYTTSSPFASSGSDHFNRLPAATWDAQGNWGSPVTNYHNSYYIGIEDHDGIGYGGEQWVKLDPVNISGATNLEVKIRLAAPSPLSNRYEADDYFIVEYQLNGAGGYIKIGEFRGVSSGTGVGNSFFHDVNLDGVTGTGDDVAMTGIMADITYNLDTRAGSTITGNTIEVRVRFSSEGSHEEMAFDDIRIGGTSASCSITTLAAGTQTSCNPGTNTYSQDVEVTYSSAPASGTLDVNGLSFAIGTSPQTVTLTGLVSDGNSVNVMASFSADAACTATQNGLFTAPVNCEPPCNIGDITAGTQFPCSGSTNKYAQEVIVSYTNAPASGTLEVNGQSFAIGTSPQTVALTGLESDGAAVNVTAEFSAEGACTLTTNSVFTAATSCITACTPSAIASEGFEAADYTGYTTSTPFFNDGTDAFDRGDDANFSFESPVSGEQGTNYIGIEDVPGEQWLALNAINIVGAFGVQVKFKLAAVSTVVTRYEADDYVIVEYQLDGTGPYAKIGEFRGILGGGSFYHDVNLDGVTGSGDDVQMTASMADVTYNLDAIAGYGVSGSTIKVRVRFSLQDAQEEVAFDDIRVEGCSTSCSINALTAGTQTTCDPGSNTYSQDVEVTYSSAPTSGTLDVNGQSFPITASPQTVTLTGLVSDGNAVDAMASFSADAACTVTQNALFTAPSNCEPPCNISGITAGVQFPCSRSNNKYAQEVVVSYSNAPATGTLDVYGQSFPIGTSPQTVTLIGLESDGLTVDITAEFSAEGACTLTTNSVFTAPTSCSTGCTSSEIGNQGFEAADYTGYTTSTPFFNDGTDAFDRGDDANFNFESPVLGKEGSNYIGIEDVPGEQWLVLDAINITGVFGIQVKFKLAAISTLATRYEADDYVIVEYQLNVASAYTKIGEFRGVSGPGGVGNSFYHDVNLDGVTGDGDDVQMTATMADVTYNLDDIAGYGVSGSSINVRVRFSLQGSQEEVAFDDIRVEGATLDDASFSYAAFEFCQNEPQDPAPTIKGATGGLFSAAAGLIIDASTGLIDLSASTPSIYTVTYTTSGACSNAASVSVTIKDSGDLDCATAGVDDDPELHNNILLYPNPVNDGFITIENKSNEAITKIVIHDMLGKIINAYHLNSKQDVERIALKAIQPGFYFVKIFTEKTSVIKKIIIN